MGNFLQPEQGRKLKKKKLYICLEQFCSDTHLRMDVTLSTVTRDRSWAEPSRLRRQLRA